MPVQQDMKKEKKAPSIWNTVFSVLLAALCLGLMGACVYIYRAGTAPGVDVLDRQAHFALAAKKVCSAALPFALLTLLCALAAGFLGGRAKEKRFSSMSARAKKMPGPEKKLSGYAYLVVYALALVLILLGILNGGLRDVLIKAVNICTECIGLG